ncbi:MAG: flagellar motor switch protein FliG [Lautropia sp. SCN 70-15]|nr:MAG: flagellar motor switch protein FliG [Lautropia sp. SCN 70-15]
MNEQGLADSAILLMALGEEAASEVFRHLGPKEAERLGEVMARTRGTSHEKLQEVLGKFHTEAAAVDPLVADSGAYVRSVLQRALGEDRASLLIERIVREGGSSGIESLKWMDARSVADLVADEHPQILASILAHLEREHASAILGHFPEALRGEVLLRIATLDGIQPGALRELDEALNRLLAGGKASKRPSLGGSKAAAEIMTLLGPGAEVGAIERIREANPELADRIAEQMFTFDDLERLDDRSLQSLLREVAGDMLIVALKGADPALRERIFRNMSQRAAETLRDDLESRGPVRIVEVEAQQKEILKIAKRLADEGQIALGGGADAFL